MPSKRKHVSKASNHVEKVKKHRKAFVLPSFLVEILFDMLGSTPQVVTTFLLAFQVSFDLYPKLEAARKACKFAFMCKVFRASLSFKVLGASYSSCLAVALEAVTSDPSNLVYFDLALRSDKASGLALVQQAPWCFFHLGDNLKEDRQVVELAVSQSVHVFKTCDAKWRADRQVVMKASVHGRGLQMVAEELRNDQDVAMAFCAASPSTFRHASPRLKNDKQLALRLVGKYNLLNHFSLALRNDKQVVLSAMQKKPSAFQFAGSILQADKQVAMKAVRANGMLLRFADPVLKHDLDVVFQAVTKHGESIAYACPSMRNDLRIASQAVRQCGQALLYVGLEARNDLGVVLLAVQNDGLALRFAPDKYQLNRKVVLQAVAQNGRAIKHAHHCFKADLDVVRTALEQNFFSFTDVHFGKMTTKDVVQLFCSLEEDLRLYARSAPNKLKDLKECLTKDQVALMAENGFWLEEASLQVRSDKVSILKAVSLDGGALRYASTKLRGDKQVVRRAIKNSVRALKFANKALRNDFSVVRQAILQDGMSLQYASKELCDHDLLVSTAIKKDPRALEFASPGLKAATWAALEAVSHMSSSLMLTNLSDSKEVVLQAVRRNGEALQHASKRLRADLEVVRTAIQSNFRAIMHARHFAVQPSLVVFAALQEANTACTRETMKFFVAKFGQKAWEDLARSYA